MLASPQSLGQQADNVSGGEKFHAILEEDDKEGQQDQGQSKSVVTPPPTAPVKQKATISLPPRFSNLGAAGGGGGTPTSQQGGEERKRKRIAQYEILQVLGRGSQGIVFKARDTQNPDTMVAIKTLRGGSLNVQTSAVGARDRGIGRRRARPGGGMSAASRQASHEIALLKKVNHPNIVRLIGVIDTTTDKDIHLVLEFCKGGPLRQLSDNLLLKNSGLPLQEDEARIYFRQLASALRYLHFHGIVHRDIKPSNLIIDRQAQVLKLTDLGIATQTKQNKASKPLGNDDEIIATTMIVGTPAFLPPEYFKIKRNEEAMQRAEFGRQESDLAESNVVVVGGGDELDAATLPVASSSSSSSSESSSASSSAAPQTFAGRAADVWALGVTLFSFIFGGLPQTYVPRARRPSLNHSTSSSRQRQTALEGKFSSRYSSSGEGNSGGGTGSSSSAASPLIPQRSPSSSSRSSYVSKPLTAEEMEERIITFTLRFPGTGLGTSSRLRGLLSKMLNKDPRFRITINEICNHEWLNLYEPMPGLSEAQMTPIKPTKADQNNAFLKSGGFLTFIKRAFRSLRSKAHLLSYTVDDQIRGARSKEFKTQEQNNKMEQRLNQEEIFE